MKKTLRFGTTLYRLRLLFLFVGVLIAATPPQPAYAICYERMVEDTYYHDAALTQYAGDCTRLCNGAWVCSGVKTAYRTRAITDYCGCT
jgi:hypothetical protein